jgi:hypothetical protein
MARYLKNPDLVKNNKFAARLPIVPSSSYGDAPVNGLIRFNQATSRIEFYYGGGWSQVAKIGSVQLVVDNFTGDGVNTVFNSLSQSESDPTAIAVFVGGVYQIPTTNYTVSGTVITFTSPPPAPSLPNSPNTIIVIHNINSTNVPA